MQINLQDPNYLYRQLKEVLQDNILKELKPGSCLPSERQLSKIYKVSVITVRKALKELVDKGVIYRRQGKGTFIGKSMIRRRQSNLSQTRAIGVIVPEMKYFFPEIVRGIESVLSEKGYKLLLCCSNLDCAKEERYLKSFINASPQGIIFAEVYPSKIGNYIKRFQDKGIVLGAVERKWDHLGVPCVVSDHVRGAYLATEHLAKLGHKRISYVTPSGREFIVFQRLKGYKQALINNGLKFSNDMVLKFDTNNTDEEKIIAELRTILARREYGTAIFAFNDILAARVAKAADDVGIDVPKELALVGYDDSEIATLLRVPLTSVNTPKFELGTMIAEIVINGIERKNPVRGKVKILVPRLVVRGSCGAKRSKIHVLH